MASEVWVAMSEHLVKWVPATKTMNSDEELWRGRENEICQLACEETPPLPTRGFPDMKPVYSQDKKMRKKERKNMKAFCMGKLFPDLVNTGLYRIFLFI